jgi:dTDP-4-dehydrorhamnose 3,5-epimerase
MKVKETHIEGLLIVEPAVYRDPRGYFMETYHRSRLASLGIHCEFIQDNQSRSTFGVIRGLHYQREPHA